MRLEVRYVSTEVCAVEIMVRGHAEIVAPIEQEVYEAELQLAPGVCPATDDEAEEIAFRFIKEHIISVRRLHEH